MSDVARSRSSSVSSKDALHRDCKAEKTAIELPSMVAQPLKNADAADGPKVAARMAPRGTATAGGGVGVTKAVEEAAAVMVEVAVGEEEDVAVGVVTGDGDGVLAGVAVGDGDGDSVTVDVAVVENGGDSVMVGVAVAGDDGDDVTVGVVVAGDDGDDVMGDDAVAGGVVLGVGVGGGGRKTP